MLVQADDISGEIVGDTISTLMSIGAANVQVISTVTKKNRAGYIFLIDCPEANTDKVSQYLLSELSIGGYHILSSTHIAWESHIVKKRVEIRAGDQTLQGESIAKILSSEGRPYSVKLEHDSILELKNSIKSELGVDMPAAKLASILSSLWHEELGDKIIVKLL